MALVLSVNVAWADGVVVDSVDLQHNVSRSGQRGLSVDASVTFDGYSGETVRVEAFFNYEATGLPVQAARNGRFRTPAGNATVQENITIQSDHTRKTVSLFIPYQELAVNASPARLQAEIVVVWQKTREELARSSKVGFNFNGHVAPQGAAQRVPEGQGDAGTHRIWVVNPTDQTIKITYRDDDPNSSLQNIFWNIAPHQGQFLKLKSGPFLLEDGNGLFEIGNSRWRTLKDLCRLESVNGITAWKLDLHN